MATTDAGRRRRRRGRFLLLRLLQGVLTLLVVSILIFVATQLLPGDVARVILGDAATPERLAALRVQLGLDLPVHQQYLNWLGGVLRGDPGQSLVTGRPVLDMVGVRLVNSLTLAGVAMLVMLPLALLAGVSAARRRGKLLDRLFLGTSMIANATPEFVIGSVLVVLLGTTVWPILPPVALLPTGQSPLMHLPSIALPVLTLVIAGGAYLARLVRVSFIDVMSSEYIQMAKLKGLSERRIVYRHALPNALGAVIPAASLVAAITIGGIVVVEYLFAYPGIGSLLLESIRSRDLPVIQAVVLIIAASYFILNFLADTLAGGRDRRA
ncbi:MAG: peptide ABC transporter permease [Micrococcales bacterium 73-13]|nr:MAG: peptide ABC transporter permease [Micrococcales bacterium 73-13]